MPHAAVYAKFYQMCVWCCLTWELGTDKFQLLSMCVVHRLRLSCVPHSQFQHSGADMRRLYFCRMPEHNAAQVADRVGQEAWCRNKILSLFTVPLLKDLRTNNKSCLIIRISTSVKIIVILDFAIITQPHTDVKLSSYKQPIKPTDQLANIRTEIPFFVHVFL